MPAPDWADELTAYASAKLEQNLAQLGRCAALLSRAQLWQRANPHCNSVANLLLHLSGNVGQWILGGVDGRPVARDRPAEFSACGGRDAAELLAALRETVRAATDVLRRLDAARLSERRTIQGYEVSVLTAVLHVVEHFSFHTGQIVQIAKTLRGVDVSLYDAQGRNLASATP
jgi:uncharacterized damage-inducible protein DinB